MAWQVVSRNGDNALGMPSGLGDVHEEHLCEVLKHVAVPIETWAKHLLPAPSSQG